IAAPPSVPSVLPPVTAEPTAPPAAAPPTVPTVSPRPMPEHAERPSIPATAHTAIKDFNICTSLVKRFPLRARGSGAAAQQEDHEQDGNRHPEGPQQDVAHLPFLLLPPLLQLLHTSLLRPVMCHRQQSPCRQWPRDPAWGFPLQCDCTRVSP